MSKKSNGNSDLCICKICVCGRHHCPHQPIKTNPTGPCVLSEYSTQFIPRPLPGTSSFKPLSTYSRNSVPFEDKTNHRIDFVPHQLEKKYVHQRELYKPSEDAFEKNTSYTSEFTPKFGDKVMMFKRSDQRKELGKFEGTPSYKTDFQSWPISPRETYGKSAPWVPPNEVFEAIPTYSTDYVKYNDVTPRESFKPNLNTQVSKDPFQDMTDYRQSYKQHPLESRFSKEKVEWNRPSVPFVGETTTASDFKEKPLSMSKSFKPPAIAKLSSDPLQSDTTHKADYKPWGLEKRFIHQADRYQPPEGVMLSDTTYIRDFVPYRAERTAAFKPRVAREALSEFQGKTSYTDDFKKWQITPRDKYGPNRTYMPPEDPLESTTTHNTHFVPFPISVRQSFKRPNETRTSNEPFIAESQYRSDFTLKEMEVCPTVSMGTPRAKFEFTGEMNEKGHLLVALKDTEDSRILREVAVH